MLWILDATTLADKQPPVLIDGNADNGGGGIANGFDHAVPEDARGPGAADRRRRQQGGRGLVLHQRREPARSGAWLRRRLRRARPQSRARLRADAGDLECHPGRRRRRRLDVRIRTGDRRQRHLPRHRQRHGPGTMAGNFGESFVKLRYTAGVVGRRQRQAEACRRRLLGRLQRLRARGRRPGPRRRRRLPHPRAGQPHRRRQGRHPLQPRQEQPREGQLESALQPSLRRDLSAERAERRRRPADDDGAQSELADRQPRPQPSARHPTGKSYHIHGTPVYMEQGEQRARLSLGRERAAQGLQLRLRHQAHHRVPRPGDAVRVGQHARARRHARRTPCRLLQRHEPPAPASCGACTRRRGTRTRRWCTARWSPTTRRRSPTARN